MDDERTLAELSDEPVDDRDLAALRQVRALYDAIDPMPDDLVERIGFALALDEMYDEVARMSRMPVDALSVRGEQTAKRTESLTFSADQFTAMVTVTRPAPDRLRLDGWLAPAGPWRVRLRLQGGGEESETVADADGRFSFEGLPEGFGQLSFHPDPGGADAHGEGLGTVVTPLFQL
jgi:hypothetical protein